jgi:tetratricopeptide (TPR) repeat protein
VVVGRSVESDITLLDSSVSRKHFELHRTPDGFVLKDLGSGNGTLIEGDKVDEIPMVHGMVVEVGMSRLQWLDPAMAGVPLPEIIPTDGDVDEAKTQVIDLASIQLDPSFATKLPPRPATADRSVIRSVDRSPPVTDRAAVPRVSAARGPAQEAGRVAKWAGVAVIGILAIVGAASLFGLVDLTPESPPPDRSSGAQDSESLMAKGLEAFTGWRWSEARVHFEAARERHPDKAKVESALARVGQEEAAAAVMEHVRAALEATRFRDAIHKLEEIPDSSVYYGDAKALIDEATEGLVSAHLETARKLSAEGKRRPAIIELESALQLLPGDPEAQALLRNLQDAMIAVAPPRRPARRTSRPPREGRARRAIQKDPKRKRVASDFEIEPEWPEDDGTLAVAAALDVGPGLAQYGAGNFDDAIALLARVMRNTDSDRQRDRAKRLVADIRAFKSLWRSANDSAASERTVDAIASLKRSKALDRAISGAYRRRIDRVLATQYATQANGAMLSAKFAKAGTLARKSLALNPSQAVARSVMDEVRSKAEGWLSSARSLSRRNPDKAKTLLTQVLTVFPKRDARYIEAYGLLKQIDSGDED